MSIGIDYHIILPLDIKEKAIAESGIPEQIFNESLPVSINETELEKYLKLRDAEEHTTVAEKIKKKVMKKKSLIINKFVKWKRFLLMEQK